MGIHVRVHNTTTTKHKQYLCNDVQPSGRPLLALGRGQICQRNHVLCRLHVLEVSGGKLLACLKDVTQVGIVEGRQLLVKLLLLGVGERLPVLQQMRLSVLL